MKKLTKIMKSYEDKIYERFIKKTAINTIDKKNEKEDPMNASVKYPFVGDASFLTNYNRLLKGYQNEANFQQQQQQFPHDVKMPSELGIYQPKNITPHDQKSYVDTHANSKYYFPQDYEPQYTSTNIYNNKPINDISNQQTLYMSQFDKQGLVDPYSSQQNFGQNSLYNTQSQGNLRNSGGYGLPGGLPGGVNVQGIQGGYGTPGQFGVQSGYNTQGQYLSPHGQQTNMHQNRFAQQTPFSEEELRLRRNIELLGGIEKTIPNMERSLRDNELKNIEQNFKYQTQFDATGNTRLNNLLQPNNQMRNLYSPQFETPNIRSQSPLRGEYPDLNRNPLLYSPQRTLYPQTPQTQTQQYPVETESKPTVNVEPQIRDPLFEKSINTPYKPSFASSRALRNEKSEILNVQYQIPENWGRHNE